MRVAARFLQFLFARKRTRQTRQAHQDPIESYSEDLFGHAMTNPLIEQEHAIPLPMIEGGWTTILADPPWRFTNRTGKVAPEHRRLDRYSTMSLDDICAMPVHTVAARNSHLYMWVPNALLPDGLRVMEAWGFRYVSNIVWAKRRKDCLLYTSRCV